MFVALIQALIALMQRQPAAPPPAAKPVVAASPLAGLPMRYLIGTDDPGPGAPGVITHCGYRCKPVKQGISTGYCNLFDEENTGKYGPYMKPGDTASQYKEGQIDPRGRGWRNNLDDQFTRRWGEGFRIIELDNPDAYDIEAIIGACDLAEAHGFKILAKNPGLLDVAGNRVRYTSHASVLGIIVERGAGDPSEMDALRRQAGRPDLPVWFVFFDKGTRTTGAQAARQCAQAAKAFPGMFVSYSAGGEYTRAEFIQ